MNNNEITEIKLEVYLKEFNNRLNKLYIDSLVFRDKDLENELRVLKEEINCAIEKYSKIEREFRVKQIDIIDNLISNDFNKIIAKMEKLNCIEDATDDLEVKKTIKSIMEKINKRKETIKRYYHNAIEKHLSLIASDAIDKMGDCIKNENFFVNFKKQIFSGSTTQIQSLNRNVKTVWGEVSTGKIDSMPSECIKQTIFNEYPELRELIGAKVQVLAQDEVAVTSVQPISNRKITRKKEKVENSIKDIITLLTRRTNGELGNKVSESIDYIPLIVLEAMSILTSAEINSNNTNLETLLYESKLNLVGMLGSAVDNHRNVLNGVAAILGIDTTYGTESTIQAILGTLDIENSAATGLLDASSNSNNSTLETVPHESKLNLGGMLGSVADNRKNVLNGVAAILGIDAADGTGDIAQVISNTLGTEINEVTSVTITGILVIIIISRNLISKLNKDYVETFECSKAIINSIKNEIYNDMVSNFDELLNKIFEKIEHNLEVGYGLQERESRYLIYQKDISEAKAFSLEFRENIYRYRCSLG